MEGLGHAEFLPAAIPVWFLREGGSRTKERGRIWPSSASGVVGGCCLLDVALFWGEQPTRELLGMQEEKNLNAEVQQA